MVGAGNIETSHYRYKHKVLANKMVVNPKVFATGP
jgi:hypothetical protein